MRRAHANQYPPDYMQGMQDPTLETENDRITDKLKGKIQSLKSLTIEIGSEVRGQNQYLKDMDDEFDNAGGFLGKAMGRVKKLASGSHNHVVLYLLVFSLCVFLFLWLLIRFSS
ncbi:unnamed protein product [Orchesella dallaii]|uniref:t-SNARE coiled-coil homology domain-containing protein n=1 Tax=Orchesella dallaii TaxID=48710 RepID=A0ABP1SAR4_9HEXA